MAEKQTVIAKSPIYYPACVSKDKDGHHGRGAKIQMSVEDAQRHAEQGLVIILSGESPEAAVEGSAGEEVQGLEALKALWTVKLSPEDYLKRYENGPHAELALRIITAEADAAEEAAAANPLITSKSVPSPE
jgi:hypothetical protein